MMELSIFLYSEISDASISLMRESFNHSSKLKDTIKNWKDPKNSKGKKTSSTTASTKSKTGSKISKKEKPVLSLKFILQFTKEVCEISEKPEITETIPLPLIISVLQTGLIQLKNV